MIKKTALFFMLVCLLSFTCLAQTFETMKKYQIKTLQKKVSYGVWLRLK